jgi:hypothetical protein
MDGARCVVFCTTSLSLLVVRCCCVCGFYTLGSGFPVPARAFAYFIVNLIVSISLCSMFYSSLQFNYYNFIVIIVIVRSYVIELS